LRRELQNVANNNARTDSKSRAARPGLAGAPPSGAPAGKKHAPAPSREMESLYRLQAEICRAMGHPRRIQILDLLAHGELTGSELRRALGIGKVNLSQHLSVMKQAGLIRSRHRGREVLYALTIREISGACQLIRSVLAERLRQGANLAKTLQESGRLLDRGES
jgi:DNA-binding transcriptional ArsR family regulator